jgi:glycosyltransferase involved in cell wall biosynthesis
VKPLVSILIPAYNAEAWVADTIRSALAQTWPRKEIIVVDDGSRDATFAVARQFASAGVRVVSQPNAGAATARNHAFSLSQGGFIQWLDADDLLAPDKIERQMDAAAAAGQRTLLSSAWGTFFYRPARTRFSPTALWADLPPADWLVCKLQHNLFMQTGTWLVSRELTTAAGPWDTRLSYDDDGEYFARMLLAADRVRFVPEARVLYRLSGAGSLSYIGRSDRKLESLLRSMRLHIQYLRSLEESERVRSASRAFLQRNLAFFYPQRPDLVEQLQQLASTLGAPLDVPRLSWKYAWVQQLFGWDAAKRMQMLLPGLRWSMVQRWDKFLSHFEKPAAPAGGANHLFPA